uniref:Uncharacterized protein n=2 Tax=Oryza sativa subsp. japonica TaxID=39947 RepID=Q7G7I2_ORYSJ|nr:hypothetical protein [Oryza sativa Japonica Group]AAM95690.1 hypothetical protein [Oryza sativa Japonica Group]AAP54542.1 hypothetical protein LOC_Os10g36410 [Oryza sativa Japonica Group]
MDLSPPYGPTTKVSQTVGTGVTAPSWSTGWDTSTRRCTVQTGVICWNDPKDNIKFEGGRSKQICVQVLREITHSFRGTLGHCNGTEDHTIQAVAAGDWQTTPKYARLEHQGTTLVTNEQTGYNGKFAFPQQMTKCSI